MHLSLLKLSYSSCVDFYSLSVFFLSADSFYFANLSVYMCLTNLLGKLEVEINVKTKRMGMQEDS